MKIKDKMFIVRNDAGKKLAASVYLKEESGNLYFLFASSGGTHGKGTSNPERKQAVELIGQRIKKLGRRAWVCKGSCARNKLSVEPQKNRQVSDSITKALNGLDCSERPFALTVENMTMETVKYLLTGSADVWQSIQNDEMTMERGDMPLDLLESTEERRKELIARIKRNRKAVLEARRHYGDKCMAPGCEHRIMQENRAFYVEVHHLIPVSQDGADSLENMVVLCPHHHAEIHHSCEKSRENLKAQVLEFRKNKYGW